MLNVGDEVMMMEKEPHAYNPECYPIKGSIGVVVWYSPDDETALIDWGQDSGVDLNEHDEYAWWCGEERLAKVNANTQVNTQKEVCNMSKFKVGDKVVFTNAEKHKKVSRFYPVVKNMVAAAYRSGYGRATKGRSFIIKPKVGKKPSIEKSIDDVLGGKMIVTFYKDDDSYNVANFAYADENGGDTRIYADIFYSSAGDAWSFGFDTISDPDCEMYVAIPFSEVVGQFNSDSIKALYGGSKHHIKLWAIGKFFNSFMQTYAFVTFKNEDNNSVFYPEVHNSDFKALVPICDYLKHEGVNV